IVPSPRRHTEDIPLFPIEAFSVDDRISFTFSTLIHKRASVLARFSFESFGQQLNRSSHSLHDVTTRQRITVLHNDSVERVWCIYFFRLQQRRINSFPRIFKEWRIRFVPFFVRRNKSCSTISHRRVIDRSHSVLSSY